MAVFKPLELMDEEGKPTGLWHYTKTDGGGTYAIGHCGPWETCPVCKGHSGLLRKLGDSPCERCGDKGIIRKVNACPGHATPEEATAHYRQYLLDKARCDGHDESAQHKCGICGTWTQGYAMVGDLSLIFLCDEHRNREGLEKCTGKHGEPIR